MTGGNGKSEDLQGIQAVRGGMPAANFSKNMRKTRPLFQRRGSGAFFVPRMRRQAAERKKGTGPDPLWR
ncbi:hypothetical protein HMPREF1546_02709 [Oscillibacter sp. KLE 1745]|nr:hypothetical protein HMPREF1546_02709 [Oscillibacter sp. KLE 1745]